MPVEANGNNLLLGRGKLYFDRFVSGAKSGFRFLGDCSQLEISPSVDKKEKFANTKGAATKIASVIMSQTHTLSITMEEYILDNMAIALLGDTAAMSQTTTPITGEVLTSSIKQGRCYATAKRKPGSMTVKSDANTGVLNTDYEVLDAESGLIRVIPGSTKLLDGSPLTIDYTPGTLTTTKMAAGLTSNIEGALKFIGDPANGNVFDADFWHIKINPSGALALITQDWGNIPVQAEILDDGANHPTEPLYQIVQR